MALTTATPYAKGVIDMAIEAKILGNTYLSESGCWEFGTTNTHGYGVITINCKQHRAHRLMWLLRKGEIPDNLFVLHSCDNRCCCNPDHLFLGTAQDNVDDMRAKGRDAFGQNFGIKNGQAKLTDEDIPKIRLLLDQGHTQQYIADQFGVSRSRISYIKHGKNWAHIP